MDESGTYHMSSIGNHRREDGKGDQEKGEWKVEGNRHRGLEIGENLIAETVAEGMKGWNAQLGGQHAENVERRIIGVVCVEVAQQKAGYHQEEMGQPEVGRVESGLR